jgi:diaminopimelate decarboxylase
VIVTIAMKLKMEERCTTFSQEGAALRIPLVPEGGTPVYVYSYQTLVRHFTVFDEAFKGMPHLVCYSAKANSNLALLRLFVNLGGGVDVVSGGELYRAVKGSRPA